MKQTDNVMAIQQNADGEVRISPVCPTIACGGVFRDKDIRLLSTACKGTESTVRIPPGATDADGVRMWGTH